MHAYDRSDRCSSRIVYLLRMHLQYCSINILFVCCVYIAAMSSSEPIEEKMEQLAVDGAAKPKKEKKEKPKKEPKEAAPQGACRGPVMQCTPPLSCPVASGMPFRSTVLDYAAMLIGIHDRS